jgi:cation diffusion facilitator CzcD-associated flavoprotein CzcO
MQVAVIGSGVSGIAAAHVLQKHGHEVVVFEKSAEIGGVWALAYPEVCLQNTGTQYHFSDFPWPFKPSINPTGKEIRRYLQLAVKHFDLDIRFNHGVVRLEEKTDGWVVSYRNADAEGTQYFDYVVVAIGQYTEGKHRPTFAREDDYQGRIMTERDLKDLREFDEKTIAVVGFGKSAVDIAAMAAPRANKVNHVFRTPRWLIPARLFGLHNSYVLFNRISSIMMNSWVHPSKLEHVLHKKFSWLVNAYWKSLQWVYRAHNHIHALHLAKQTRRRLATYLPEHGVLFDMRSACAQAPKDFFKFVKKGQIQPHHAELKSFTEKGLLLSNGQEVDADIVVLSLGSEKPRLPFMPAKYREMLEKEEDGPQLYRHMIHPAIKNLAFAGFNHGFMHIPAAEVGVLWLCALLSGDIQLPSTEQMKKSITKIQAWKRQNIAYEPSRACAVNTRYQQYIDTLLKDLRINPYRKMPNFLAELFGVYGASDYFGLSEEYEKPETPYRLVAVDT